jgi:hypothetical protein
LAVVATDVRSGHQWPVVIIERPDDAPDDYEHDLDVADGAVADLIEGDRYVVWRAYCDDQYISVCWSAGRTGSVRSASCAGTRTVRSRSRGRSAGSRRRSRR